MATQYEKSNNEMNHTYCSKEKKSEFTLFLVKFLKVSNICFELINLSFLSTKLLNIIGA